MSDAITLLSLSLFLSLSLSLCVSVSLSLSACAGTTSGETVLHRAASLCQRTICHYLVEAGASLMKTDMQVAPGQQVCDNKTPPATWKSRSSQHVAWWWLGSVYLLCCCCCFSWNKAWCATAATRLSCSAPTVTDGVSLLPEGAELIGLPVTGGAARAERYYTSALRGALCSLGADVCSSHTMSL